MVSAPPLTRPGTTIAVIGGLVLLLVAAAVVASLVLDSGQPASYPPDSAEATFQRYYQAYQRSDTQTAYDCFSSRIQGQMSYDQFSWYASQYRQPNEQSTIARIDRVDRASDHTILYLTVERVAGSGIDLSRYSEERQIRLIQEGGAWKIDEPLIGVDPGYFLSPPAPSGYVVPAALTTT